MREKLRQLSQCWLKLREVQGSPAERNIESHILRNEKKYLIQKVQARPVQLSAWLWGWEPQLIKWPLGLLRTVNISLCTKYHGKWSKLWQGRYRQRRKTFQLCWSIFFAIVFLPPRYDIRSAHKGGERLLPSFHMHIFVSSDYQSLL